jgi:sec-independent protein translocase protein TatA
VKEFADMMPHNPIAIIILVIVVIVFFGANKLPEMAKSLGRSKNAFEEGLREGHSNDADQRR